MIPALLEGGELGYAEAAVPLRAAWYAASLGGAGLAFFALLFGHGLVTEDAARLRRWAGCAAMLGILAGIAILAVQVRALAGGQGLLDAEVWGVVSGSPAGLSYALGGIGLLLVAMLALGPGWIIPAAAGGVLACASHLLLGHTTRGGPRLLLAALLLVHLLVTAFWIGSLPPLTWVARRGGIGAARLIEGWAQIAVLTVPALLAAGLLLAWLLLGSVEALVASRYGWALLAKVALVSALLGLAVWHRYRLTPTLARNDPGAGSRLARSIGVEAAIAVGVLYAVAEMVATSPGASLRSMV